jgi:phosphate transport system substrate-binding protein
MIPVRSIHLSRFVVPGRGGRSSILLLLACGLGVALSGCTPSPQREPVEDSITSGRISVVVGPEAADVVTRLRDAFVGLYPDATIELRNGTSRAAVESLFAARADVAAITRELKPEERSSAVRGGLELEGYRFARDAVVIVVHPDNPVRNLALDDLRRIYSGEVESWSRLGGRGSVVVPVVRPVESDITQFFAQEVMGEMPMRARAVIATSDSEVVARVAHQPDAIGYVSMAWAERGARALEISPLRGMSYVKPDPETVYKGTYPLTRFFNLYVRPDGPPLGNGFITFVTSRDGQTLVHDAGLVPTSVPVRFVHRSPMLDSH